MLRLDLNSPLPDSQVCPLDHVLCRDRGCPSRDTGTATRHQTRPGLAHGVLGEPESGERGWEEPGGPRGARTSVAHGPQSGCRPSLGEGWGAGRGWRGRLSTRPLCVCLPSLPLSLPLPAFSLPPHPLLGNCSSEAPQSPSSPSRVDPKAPEDTHQRVDSQATFSGVFFLGGARPRGPPPRCSAQSQRPPSSRARKSRAPNPPQTKPSNSQGSHGNLRFIFSPTLTLT